MLAANIRPLDHFDKNLLEANTVTQIGQRIMLDLKFQQGFFVRYTFLPALQLTQQRIEARGQAVNLGNLIGGHAARKVPVPAYLIRQIRQIFQRSGNQII